MSNTSESFDELLRKVAAAPDVSMLSLEPGAVLAGRYRILEPLGRGAMGSVYEVADEALGERVALKLLHTGLAADPEYQKALRREVRLARRVSHPNVCRVHDLGVEGDRLFVTMELLVGETLRQHMASTPMSLSRRIDILVQIASGLAAAHRAGIVHRDVKPDNIVIDAERAVLTDFGVASPARGASDHIAGTPAYMAPELALGKPKDHRVDTYSFGVLAFELFAGRRPVPIRSIADVRALIDTYGCGPRLRLPDDVGDPEIREALEAVLRRALDVDPERRPDPIDTMATLLSRAACGEAPAAVHRARRSSRSTRAVTAVVASFASARDDADRIERPISALGGTVTTANRYRIEALFGAPRSRGDDAIRAARAALALEACCPDSSVAIHTGLVELAADARGALLATGPALERARDLVGDPGVWCSDATRGQLAGHFRLELDLGGRYRLSDREGEIAATSAPLSGRDTELAGLEAACARSFAERRATFVRITGAAGIGKTRLVSELIERVSARRELDVIALRAAPFADAGPLALLRQAAPEDRPEALRARLLERAARRPLVLCADDLQWADPASREFLAELERQIDDAALFGLFIARDPAVLWPAPPRSTTLAVGPLPPSAARDLVIGVAPIAGAAAIERAVERTGNPLLLEELGRALREGRKSLPDTVVAAAQEQLDQLDDWCREIARRAAVLGGDFTSLELAQLADLNTVVTPDTDGAIAELIERGVLITAVDDEGAVRYRFASPLVRDTAYEMTAVTERTRWHAAAAAFLEAQRDRDDLLPLADHWERAGDLERARHALVRAGERALSRFAFEEAAAVLLRAEAMSRSSEVGVDLLMHLGLALEPTDGAAAEERFARAFRETAAGDSRRPQLCLYLGRRAAARSDNEAARIWYERGLSELESAGPAAVTVRAGLCGNLGSLHGYVMNDNQTGLELSERAVALLEGTEHRRELAVALSQLGGNYMRAGRFREQLECNLRNLDIALELADPVAELTARINLGEAHKSLGEIEAALEHTRVAIGLARRLGKSAARALALSNLAILLLETGDLDAAAERADQALELGKRVGFDRFFYESYICLCRVHYLRGEHERAEECARKAVGIAIASGSEVMEGITLRFLAAARAARGQRDDALRHLRRAHRCLAERDPLEDARTSVVEARIQTDSGALRDAARATFERLGARLDLAHLDDEQDLR